MVSTIPARKKNYDIFSNNEKRPGKPTGLFFCLKEVTIKEFQNIVERMIPSAIAWKGDNVGVQIGSVKQTVSNILIALDLTMDVAREAKKKNVNLIVTHHPPLFHAQTSITDRTRIGELVLYLIKNNIGVFSAHTNLDSVRWGVNDVLARTLGLKNITVLAPLHESLTKISVFVPHDHVEAVAKAMHASGAGTFTKYDHCSFRSEGIGTFRGMNDARPFVGKVGVLERTNEVRIEMICETWKTEKVIAAIKESHPYEEVAFDVVPLLNENTEYGIGAVGDLDKGVPEKEFLKFVQKKLSTPSLRYTPGRRTVKRIAVCGGSGSEFIADALRQNADAMITADLKYHTFQDYEGRILLIDAGHFETEHLVLPVLARAMKKVLNHTTYKGNILVTKYSTNPVHYYTRSN